MPEDAEDRPKPLLGLSGTQTIGSALAAVTSAVVGSFLGVAGTLIGAALGSIIATVAAAVYSRTLSKAARVARSTMPLRRRRNLPERDRELLAANDAQAAESWSQRLRRQFTPKTWIKLAAVSAGIFVVAMVGITAVEFGTKAPISTLVSSTTGIDSPAAKHETTLGNIIGGTERVSQKTQTTDPADDKTPTDDQSPGQDTEGNTDGGTAGDGTTGSGGAADGTTGSGGAADGSTGDGGSTAPADPGTGGADGGAATEPAPEDGTAAPAEPVDPVPADPGNQPGQGGGAGQ
ncbi:hypothetical protein LVY72_23655 [Arthrobacter sp. I2-34]|uniref:Uncharacterized protein n=1 Tax=Arthrobacter hankyongi TaxID=2904801 RepID=A0ABS9LDZ0_9MICC|nr:hypothetical protein [Arthrobacter hankyongi]MCG2624890.1 hypothetical protein [Arthrobacter hankyongi]